MRGDNCLASISYAMLLYPSLRLVRLPVNDHTTSHELTSSWITVGWRVFLRLRALFLLFGGIPLRSGANWSLLLRNDIHTRHLSICS